MLCCLKDRAARQNKTRKIFPPGLVIIGMLFQCAYRFIIVVIVQVRNVGHMDFAVTFHVAKFKGDPGFEAGRFTAAGIRYLVFQNNYPRAERRADSGLFFIFRSLVLNPMKFDTNTSSFSFSQ